MVHIWRHISYQPKFRCWFIFVVAQGNENQIFKLQIIKGAKYVFTVRNTESCWKVTVQSTWQLLYGASGFSDMAMSSSVRDYFQVRGDLPDLQGSLSCHVPSWAIVLANKKVQKVLKEMDKSVKPKRGNTTGKCPTIVPFFLTAMAYLSEALFGSLSQVNTSLECKKNFAA